MERNRIVRNRFSACLLPFGEEKMEVVKQIFQEESGKWSFSRISTAVILIFYLSFSGYIAFTEKKIPDLPDNLYLLLLSLYGVNKVATAIKSFGVSK